MNERIQARIVALQAEREGAAQQYQHHAQEVQRLAVVVAQCDAAIGELAALLTPPETPDAADDAEALVAGARRANTTARSTRHATPDHPG